MVLLAGIGAFSLERTPEPCRSAFTLHSNHKARFPEPLATLGNMGVGIVLASDLVRFCLNCSKNIYFLLWQNLHIFSNRVSQEHIPSGKRYICYHLALISLKHACDCRIQQCKFMRMALDGVSWVPFQLSSTFITLGPWLNHSSFFLWAFIMRRERNRDDMCKIHVLWRKGGCYVNLIVRREYLALHLYAVYHLWEMLTPSWWF